MRGEVEKMKIMNKNKQYCDMEMNSVETQTTHSQTVAGRYLHLRLNPFSVFKYIKFILVFTK